MLPSPINQLLLVLRYFTMGQVLSIPSLTLRHPYPVVGDDSVTSPYETTFMFTLQSDYAVTLKIYLPSLYDRCVDDADIDDINLWR